MTLRLRFWLFAMDVCALCFGFGSRAYLWALERAVNADPPGHGAKCGEGDPF